MAAQATLSDSNDYSSSICYFSNTETLSQTQDSSTSPSPSTTTTNAATVTALSRLSDNLDTLFLSPSLPSPLSFSDARLVLSPSDPEIHVHRCVLAARSPFFRTLFTSNLNQNTFQMKDFAFDIGYHSLLSVLSYLYSGKVKPLPDGVCMCVDRTCLHVTCHPAVKFMGEVLFAAFTFQISELVTLYQRHLLDILDRVAIDEILDILHVASLCDRACEKLQSMCVEIVASALVKSDIDIIAVEKALAVDIVKEITDLCLNLSENGLEKVTFPDKHTQRIQQALDSDDAELVRMLLKEGHTTLDNAFALHYAVAYCDKKITTELLDIGLVDVNHRNARGHTVLHVAARRKDPNIIVSLLTKGARPYEQTPDGMKTLQICQRQTKLLDYNKPTKEGMDTPKDRLCIEILEQAERNEPLLGEASESLTIAGEDFRSKLLYLENRVSLANILFPVEAKVAMDIAKVHRTSPLSMTVDLNDVPFKVKEELVARLKALDRTVELGKRFFPRCSAELNKIVDDDELSQLANLEDGTPEERALKKQRFNEIQYMITKAFIADQAENHRSAASTISSSSSSSTSIRARSKLTRK